MFNMLQISPSSPHGIGYAEPVHRVHAVIYGSTLPSAPSPRSLVPGLKIEAGSLFTGGLKVETKHRSLSAQIENRQGNILPGSAPLRDSIHITFITFIWSGNSTLIDGGGRWG